MLLCKEGGRQVKGMITEGGDILCGGKYESTDSGATKSVPFLKNERTNYVWFPMIAHEKQWALAVVSWRTLGGFPKMHQPAKRRCVDSTGGMQTSVMCYSTTAASL